MAIWVPRYVDTWSDFETGKIIVVNIDNSLLPNAFSQLLARIKSVGSEVKGKLKLQILPALPIPSSCNFDGKYPIAVICLLQVPNDLSSNERNLIKSALFKLEENLHKMGLIDECYTPLEKRIFMIPSLKTQIPAPVIMETSDKSSKIHQHNRHRSNSDTEHPLDKHTPVVVARTRSTTPPLSHEGSILGQSYEFLWQRSSILNWIRKLEKSPSSPLLPQVDCVSSTLEPLPDRRDPKTGTVLFGTPSCVALETEVRALLEALPAKLRARLENAQQALANLHSKNDVPSMLALPPTLIALGKWNPLGADKVSKKRILARQYRQWAYCHLLLNQNVAAQCLYQKAVELGKALNESLLTASCLEGWCAATLSTIEPVKKLYGANRTSIFRTVSLDDLCSDISLRTNSNYSQTSLMDSTAKSMHASFRKSKGLIKKKKLHRLEVINGPELKPYEKRLCEEIGIKMRESIDLYSKVPEVICLMTESIVRAAYFHAYIKQNLKAAQYIQEAIYLPLELSDIENVKRYNDLSKLYGLIGMKRKEAFYKRVASLQSVSPTSSNPNWNECNVLLTQALGGYRVPLDLRETPREHFSGWPSIQIRIINELIVSARRSDNFPLAARHVMFQLQFLLKHLNKKEIQENLDLLKAFATRHKSLGTSSIVLDNGIILPPVALIDFPILAKVEFPPLSPYLKPINMTDGVIFDPTRRDCSSWRSQLSCQSALDDASAQVVSPFIFSPFFNKKSSQNQHRRTLSRGGLDNCSTLSSKCHLEHKRFYSRSSLTDSEQASATVKDFKEPPLDALWVRGEPAKLLLHLYNPLPNDLALNYMGITSDQKFREIRPLILPPTLSATQNDHSDSNQPEPRPPLMTLGGEGLNQPWTLKIGVLPIFVVPERGGTFWITGYYTELYEGLRSNIKGADLKSRRFDKKFERRIKRMLQFPYTVKVTPALPLLRFSTSFPMIPDLVFNDGAYKDREESLVKSSPLNLKLPSSKPGPVGNKAQPRWDNQEYSQSQGTDNRYQIHLGNQFESLSKDSLSTSPVPSEARTTTIFASLYTGQCLDCPLTLTNLGEVATTKLRVQKEEDLCARLTPQITWTQNSIVSALPINPGSSKALTLTLYGGDDIFQTIETSSSQQSTIESSSHLGQRTGLAYSQAPSLQPLNSKKSYHRCDIHMLYSGDDIACEGYGRELVIPFCIEAKALITIIQCDVLPAESITSCYLVLDLANTDHLNEVCVQYTVDKKVDIEPGENTKIAIEIDKINPSQISRFYSPDSTKSGSPIFNQDFVAPPLSLTRNTSGGNAFNQNITGKTQTPPTINELLDAQVDIIWKLANKNIEGRLRLLSLVWTESKLDVLISPQITWELELNGKSCITGETVSVNIGEWCVVAAIVKNNSDKQIENIRMSIKCYQDYQNGCYDFDVAEKVIFVGSLNQDIDKIACMSIHKHEVRLIFLCSGVYFVDLVCNKSTRVQSPQSNSSSKEGEELIASLNPKMYGATPWGYTPRICVNATSFK